ncbi:MAG: sensor histidine kinase [Actinobacteria bacterium]|nr:sensor histidine kinase [Actinomycetota bacterium]
MPWLRRWWALTAPSALPEPSDYPGAGQPRTARDWTVDAGAFVIALALGTLILRVTIDNTAYRMTSGHVAIDVACGTLSCVALWWRRRWPFGVALACVLLGAFTTLGTVAGLLALSSLAVHRHVRPALLAAALYVPAAVVCSIWLGRTNTWSVILPSAALAAAATAWGMFIRARRQLLSTLRDRAERAEADQLVRAESARLAERTRIAREMHDVLAHRVSLIALHAGALEVARDLPPAQVRESAALLRETAHEALEELRNVIGVLRAEPGHEHESMAPQPTLADIPRLVEETRRAGAKVDLEMQVDDAASAPGPLGRDAYRIVQEALTNVGKHARGTHARVRVAGAPNRGLHVSVRNPTALGAHTRPAVPGSRAGLLGLQERVTLANGVLVHGPDASGDFVVEAELPW